MKLLIKTLIHSLPRRIGLSILALVSLFLIENLGLSVAMGTDTIESTGTARSKISEGIQSYSEGKFTEAAEQFASAAKSSKERSAESTVALFDQACARRAAGDLDAARELLLEVAIGDNPKLASSAHYNLASISAEEARKLLGEDPLSISDSKERENALERIGAAVSHYRDSLQVDSSNVDARHNLELLRIYAQELQQGWQERDAQAQRDKQDLFQFLSSLDKQQSQLREQARQLSKRQPRASRLERTKLAELQRKLLDELGPLKAKVDQSLQPPQTQAQAGQQPGPAPELSEEEKAAIQQLRQVIGEVSQKAQDSIGSAAELIGSGKFDDATKLQQDTCDRFYETYALMAPFQQVLQRAIEDQQALVDRSTSIIGESSKITKEEAGASGKDSSTAQKTTAQETASSQTIDTDWPSLAWRQNWLTKLNNAMSSKAAGLLKQLPPAEEENRVTLRSDSEDSSDAQAKPDAAEENLADSGSLDQPAPTDNSNPLEMQEASAADATSSEANRKPTEEEIVTALRRAVEKALELSPAIAEHSKSATDHLKDSQALKAKPDQEEVLRLLKEIADLLPKQPPQDQQQNNQDDKNQDNNDQQQSDQQQSDQQQSDQQKNQEQQQQDKSQDTKSNQQQSDKQESSDKQDKKDKSDTNKSQRDQPNPDDKEKDGSSQSDKDKKKENEKDKEKGQSDQQNQPDEKKQDESKQAQSQDDQPKSASESNAQLDDKAQQQKMAQERAQVILRRIREREATYRELLEQLREAQGRRSPVEKDW